METIDNLKNPSFDAHTDGNPIEGWSSSGATRSQLFGVEELGSGQYCVKLEPNGYVRQPVTKLNGPDAAEPCKNVYYKFSFDAVFQNDSGSVGGYALRETIQDVSTLQIHVDTQAGFLSQQTIKLISGRVQRVSILVSAEIPEMIWDNTVYFHITNTGTAATPNSTGDIIYIDNARLESITIDQ